MYWQTKYLSQIVCWRVEVMGFSQLLLNKFTDPRTPSMRKGRDWEQMKKNKWGKKIMTFIKVATNVVASPMLTARANRYSSIPVLSDGYDSELWVCGSPHILKVVSIALQQGKVSPHNITVWLSSRQLAVFKYFGTMWSSKGLFIYNFILFLTPPTPIMCIINVYVISSNN